MRFGLTAEVEEVDGDENSCEDPDGRSGWKRLEMSSGFVGLFEAFAE